MNALTIAETANLTMSSREIAELTGKQHKHVLEDVRKMLSELGLSSDGLSAQYKDSKGRTLPCFNLPLSVAMTYLARVSKEFGVKIMDEALKKLQRRNRGAESPARL